MTVITTQQLARALQARVGISAEAAADEAERLLDLFGFDSEILDNVLDPSDRQLFYLLEAHGLVASRSETNQLHHGQDWRSHFWQIRPERILRAAGAAAAPSPARDDDEAGAVYGSLPGTAWTRG